MTSFVALALVLSLASVSVFSLPAGMGKKQQSNRASGEDDDNELGDPDVTVPQQGAADAIEAVNTRLDGRRRRGPLILYGDIAQGVANRNADPCTARGCTWPKRSNGVVYVPVAIPMTFSAAEQRVIIQSLVEFHSISCIRFVWRRNHNDYLYFAPLTGCWSYIGRQGGRQMVSLQKNGCVSSKVIQHELLHALGFHHEQARSDRDTHVQIKTQNIQPGQLRNFDKVNTNNLGTPYDYNSIMHYSRFAFSKQYGVLPTIVPIPDSMVTVGEATEMSANDIQRLNALYQCDSS